MLENIFFNQLEKATQPKWVENDASASKPGLVRNSQIVIAISCWKGFWRPISAPCDSDLWPDPKVDRFMLLPREPLVPVGVRIGLLVFKICLQVL